MDFSTLKDAVVNYVRYQITSSVNTGDSTKNNHIINITNAIISLCMATSFAVFWERIKAGWLVVSPYIEPFIAPFSRCCKSKNKVNSAPIDFGDSLELTRENFEYYKELCNKEIMVKYTWSIRKHVMISDSLSLYILKTLEDKLKSTSFSCIDLVTYDTIESNIDLINKIIELLPVANDMFPVYINRDGYVCVGKKDTTVYIGYSNKSVFIDLMKKVKENEEFNAKKVRNPATATDLTLYEFNGSDIIFISSIYRDRCFDNYVSRHKTVIMRQLDHVKLALAGQPTLNGFGPQNVGIMLYGKPGTGKTSLIKAICNYMDRPGMIVNLKGFKTASSFKSIFKNNRYLQYVIIFEEFDFIQGVISRDIQDPNEVDDEESSEAPQSELIEVKESYVDSKETPEPVESADKKSKKKKSNKKKKAETAAKKEEDSKDDSKESSENTADTSTFDSIGVTHKADTSESQVLLKKKMEKNVHKRTNKMHELKDERMKLLDLSSVEKVPPEVLTEYKNRIAEIDKELQTLKDGLHLDTILMELDGMNEYRGRVIIATTNYINRIDSALLRPGRFDLKIELTDYSDEETRELLSLIYAGSDLTCIANAKFKSGKYTPIEIINMCKCYPMESVVKKLSI
jgi:hypothetical protein